MSKFELYEENGVKYSHKEFPGSTKVNYFLQNLKTDKIYNRVIFLVQSEHVNKLLMWWNRSKDWKVFQ